MSFFKFQTRCNFPLQVLGSKPGSNKCWVSSLPLNYSLVLLMKFNSELMVVGTVSLCRRKRHSRNSNRALTWAQVHISLPYPSGGQNGKLFLLCQGEEHVPCLSTAGKAWGSARCRKNGGHVAIREMLWSLGWETQMARDSYWSPSQRNCLLPAQSMVSVFSLSENL